MRGIGRIVAAIVLAGAVAGAAAFAHLLGSVPAAPSSVAALPPSPSAPLIVEAAPWSPARPTSAHRSSQSQAFQIVQRSFVGAPHATGTTPAGAVAGARASRIAPATQTAAEAASASPCGAQADPTGTARRHFARDGHAAAGRHPGPGRGSRTGSCAVPSRRGRWRRRHPSSRLRRPRSPRSRRPRARTPTITGRTAAIAASRTAAVGTAETTLRRSWRPHRSRARRRHRLSPSGLPPSVHRRAPRPASPHPLRLLHRRRRPRRLRRRPRRPSHPAASTATGTAPITAGTAPVTTTRTRMAPCLA